MEIAEDAEIIYAAHALKRTGRMARGIHAHVGGFGGKSVFVSISAKASDGFDYVGVTRFGHRGMIVPRADRGPASVVPTKRDRQVGHLAALRFMYKGRVTYARSTKGFHPTTDWVDKATPEIQASARATMRALARELRKG